MIWNCVTFHNEVDHLEARLEMFPLHAHVAVEGTHTHQGDDKPLYLDDCELAVVRCIADLSGCITPWERENRQRDYLVEYLRFVARPDDLVLVCDVDEHVNPEAVGDIMKATAEGPVSLAMRLHYYSLAWEDSGYGYWLHPLAMRMRDLPDDLSQLRVDHPERGVVGAGWHISYTGGEERRAAKLRAFAHAEQNSESTHLRVRHGPTTGLGPNNEMLDRVANYDGIHPALVERFG